MRIIVLRTSAMGDVALVAPVLNALKAQHPEVETILVTRKSFNPFFRQDKSLIIFNPDFQGRHKGLAGIYRLYKDLVAIGQVDHVIDIHNVLRSGILGFLFRMKGIPVSVMDKGRVEKRALVRGKSKKPLKHTVERYREVFASCGLEIIPGEEKQIFISSVAGEIASKVIGDHDVKNIGIAPFAKHNLKMWPSDNMVELTRLISRDFNVRFFLFGGRDEAEKIALITSKIPGAVNLCGKLNLDEELAVISKLDMMIAMDSSNMHMSALCGTKTVSIWGGTDPLAGFSAWRQPDEYSIRVPVTDLTCRPCTVFGKGRCKRGDFACMKWLSPGIVYHKIRELNIL